MPQVFARQHKDELLLAWFWPDGPMWLQPGGGVPCEVTSDRFAREVELEWMQLIVQPGTSTIRAVTPTGDLATFELIR